MTRRRFVVAILYVVACVIIALGACLLIDELILEWGTRNGCSMKRVTSDEDDARWWTSHMGALPAKNVHLSAELSGIAGRDGIEGDWWHPDGGSGGDAGDLDPGTDPDFNGLVAFDIACDGPWLRGRFVAGGKHAAYCFAPQFPFSFCEYVLVDPQGGADHPSTWPLSSTRLHVVPLVIATACTAVLFSPFLFVPPLIRRSRARRRAAAPVSAALPPAPFAVNLRCACHYDLRGAADDAMCPECGAVVADVKASWWLPRANARWRRLVAIGLTLMTWSLFVALVAFMLYLALGWASMNDEVHNLRIAMRARTTMFWIAYACPFIAAIGGLLLTSRDPRVVSPAPMARSRSMLRIATLVVLGAFALMWSANWIAPGSGEFFELFFFFVVVPILYLASWTAFSWFAQLAERIPDPALARRCRMTAAIVRVAVGVVVVVQVLLSLLFLLFSHGWISMSRDAAISMIRAFAMCEYVSLASGLVVALVFAVLASVFQGRLRAMRADR